MDFLFPNSQKTIQMVNILKGTRTILDSIAKEYQEFKKKCPEVVRIEPEIKDLFSQQLFLESRIQKMATNQSLPTSLSLLMLDTGRKIGIDYAISSHQKAVNKFKTGMDCLRKAVNEGESIDIAIKSCINIKQDTFEGLFSPDTFEDLIKLGLIGYAGIQSVKYIIPVLEKLGKEIKKRKR